MNEIVQWWMVKWWNSNVKLAPGQWLNLKNTVTDVDAVDDNAYPNAMNTAPHAPNTSTSPDTENKMSVRKLLDGQEYTVAKGDIIKNGFYCKSAVERCVAYLHGFSTIIVYPSYTGDRITSFAFLQLIHIDNNDMLGAAQFMVDFRGVHFNAEKALCINLQNHASIFKSIISTINGGCHGRFYVFPTSVFDIKNNYLPMKYRYSGLICQHSIENILNISERFVKSPHQPTKRHGLVGQFPNRQKGKKEAYDSIDDFLHILKEDIGEPITKRYIIEFTGVTKIDDDNENVFLPHHTSKHH